MIFTVYLLYITYFLYSMIYHVAIMQLMERSPHQNLSLLKLKKSSILPTKVEMDYIKINNSNRISPVMDHTIDNSKASKTIDLVNKSKYYSISGRTADDISDSNKLSNCRVLLARRNRLIKQYLSYNCESKEKKVFCETPNRLIKILSTKETRNYKGLFYSQKYVKYGSVCEGCKMNMDMRFINKTSNSGILIRKFVGNSETNTIFLPNNRNVYFSAKHLEFYYSLNSRYDVTFIYVIYETNRFFTIPELLYRNRG